MKVMDGTNRRSRGAGKAAVAHKRLPASWRTRHASDLHRTICSVSPGEHDASHDRMNLDERWSLDPGFDWGWSRRPVFHAGNSGLGGRIAKSLHQDQSFNNLYQKARESARGKRSGYLTLHSLLAKR